MEKIYHAYWITNLRNLGTDVYWESYHVSEKGALEAAVNHCHNTVKGDLSYTHTQSLRWEYVSGMKHWRAKPNNAEEYYVQEIEVQE